MRRLFCCRPKTVDLRVSSRNQPMISLLKFSHAPSLPMPPLTVKVTSHESRIRAKREKDSPPADPRRCPHHAFHSPRIRASRCHLSTLLESQALQRERGPTRSHQRL